MKTVALAIVKDDLSGYLRRAEREEIVITRHGRPAGVLIGFETEDDWLDYRLEHNPEFLRRIAQARMALERGERIRLEDAEPRRTRPRRRAKHEGMTIHALTQARWRPGGTMIVRRCRCSDPRLASGWRPVPY